jgi:hypothetical protein
MVRMMIRQHFIHRWAVWLIVISLVTGCASTLNKGDRAAAQGHWDEAITAYEQLVQLHPEDRVLAIRLQEYKQRAAFVHLDRGEQLLNQRRREEALGEFQLALELYPTLDEAKTRIAELQQPVLIPAPVPAPTEPVSPTLEGTLSIAPSPGPEAPSEAPPAPAPKASAPGEGGAASFSVTTTAPGGDALSASTGQTPVTQPDLPLDGSVPEVTIQPQQLTAQVGDQLSVQVMVTNVTNLFGAPFYLDYDPSRLEVVSAAEGGFLKNDGQSSVFLNSIDASKGMVIVGASRLGAVGGVNGSGSLAVVTFKATASGPVTLTLHNVDFRDASLAKIPVLLQTGHILIGG